QVAETVVQRLALDASLEQCASRFTEGVAGELDSDGIAQVFSEVLQGAEDRSTVSQGMAVQLVITGAEFGEAATVFRLGRPRWRVDAVGPAGGFEALSLTLGFEGLAETAALDGFNIDFPATVRQLLDSHQTARPQR